MVCLLFIAAGGEELVGKVKLQSGIKAKHSNTNNVDGEFFIKTLDVSYIILFLSEMDVVNKNWSVIFY